MKRFIIFPILILFIGCATGSVAGQGQFQLRHFLEVQLDNGMKILLIPDHSLPRLHLAMLVKTGARQESSEQAGINALVAGLLDQGTSKRSASQLA
jgi:zinc protease